MANMQGGQQLGTNQGKGQSAADKLALFLKVFGGEVLTAFARTSVTSNRHMQRQISSGKSAQFPVIGRTKAAYLQPGESLDDKRKDIKHTEKTINIDGLLTADVLIYDIELAGLVNLADSVNENIAGLGKPSLLEVGAKADLTDPVKLGQAVIAQLTINDRTFYTTPDVDDRPDEDEDAEATNQKHAFPATGGKVNKENVVGLFQHRSAVGTVKLKDLALERARRTEYQADQIVAKYAMGHGGLRPESAGALVFTAA
ncbi:major capsid protein [Klebsiella phage RCIP0048]